MSFIGGPSSNPRSSAAERGRTTLMPSDSRKKARASTGGSSRVVTNK
jgi:hypothetical protein